MTYPTSYRSSTAKELASSLSGYQKLGTAPVGTQLAVTYPLRGGGSVTGYIDANGSLISRSLSVPGKAPVAVAAPRAAVPGVVRQFFNIGTTVVAVTPGGRAAAVAWRASARYMSMSRNAQAVARFKYLGQRRADVEPLDENKIQFDDVFGPPELELMGMQEGAPLLNEWGKPLWQVPADWTKVLQCAGGVEDHFFDNYGNRFDGNPIHVPWDAGGMSQGVIDAINAEGRVSALKVFDWWDQYYCRATVQAEYERPPGSTSEMEQQRSPDVYLWAHPVTDLGLPVALWAHRVRDPRSEVGPVTAGKPRMPVHHRRPPPPGTKERKGATLRGPGENILYTVLNAVTKALSFTTEVHDVVESLFDALPEHIKEKYKGRGMEGKIDAIAKYFYHIDINQAMINLIYNHYEDKVVAGIHTRVERNSPSVIPGRDRMLGGRGLSFGPAF